MDIDEQLTEISRRETAAIGAVERRLLADVRYVEVKDKYESLREHYDIIARRHLAIVPPLCGQKSGLFFTILVY